MAIPHRTISGVWPQTRVRGKQASPFFLALTLASCKRLFHVMVKGIKSRDMGMSFKLHTLSHTGASIGHAVIRLAPPSTRNPSRQPWVHVSPRKRPLWHPMSFFAAGQGMSSPKWHLGSWLKRKQVKATVPCTGCLHTYPVQSLKRS